MPSSLLDEYKQNFFGSKINRIDTNWGINSNLALVLFVDGTIDYLSQWDLRADPYQKVVTEYLAIKCF